jgi:hypothetical protein
MSKRPGERSELPQAPQSSAPKPDAAVAEESEAVTASPAQSKNKRPAVAPAVSTTIMSGLNPTVDAASVSATDTPASTDIVPPPAKKSRTNTPWTPAEEQRLKIMRDAGNSWAEIAKVSTSAAAKVDLSSECSVANCFQLLDFSQQNGRQCQETLVQGKQDKHGFRDRL